MAWTASAAGWGDSNATLISGARYSVLIDTLWDLSRTQAMLDAFAPCLSTAPIRYLVNTHCDGDHWYGNQLVEAEEIIATSSAGRAMEHEGPAKLNLLRTTARFMRMLSSMPIPRRIQWRLGADYIERMLAPFDFGGIQAVRATSTFVGRLPIVLEERRVELLELGPAHTGGDLVAYLPDDRLICAGDIIFNGVLPVMWDGSSRNWIHACEKMLEWDVTTVVPGHGPVSDLSAVDTMRKYWQFLRSVTRRHFDKGDSPFDTAVLIARSDEYQKQPFAEWEGQERTVINVYALHHRLMGRGRHMNPLQKINALRKAAVFQALRANANW